MQTRLPWMFAALLLIAPVHGLATNEVAITYENNQLLIQTGKPRHENVAWGSFKDGLNFTGWGVLDVASSGQYSDELQHRAAGMAEGFLTAKHIHSAYHNAIGYLFKGNVSQPTVAFLREQRRWAAEKVRSAAVGDIFWSHVGAVLAQLDGLIEGYAEASKRAMVPALPDDAFLILNGVGDIFQIMPAVDEHHRPDFASMSSREVRNYIKMRGMCSALIKVPGAFEDLFMAHSAWFSYGDTNRIFKHYHFRFHAPAAANRISFSSYPGYLESLDDFYMMDSGLGMTQTSNDVMNANLFELIKPQSLLAWQRVRVSNAIASTGKEWWQTFRTFASGTYVNQYMIVDFKLFTPGHSLRDGTLWVIEEIPGLVAGADQSEALRRGYWPSYNVPYYPEIYNRSGYNNFDLGQDGAYQLAPRAKIFRRDEASVVDLASLKRIMRYANYSDPYARDEANLVDYSAAICMRGDLDATHRRLSGCYDTKVTSHLHGFWNLSAEAVNGPSSIASDGTGGQSGNPPFAWHPEDAATTVHEGLPASYAFDFIAVRPLEPSCSECFVAPSSILV